MEKCVITAALTGGVHGKEANPNIPVHARGVCRRGSQLLECRLLGRAHSLS